MRREESGFALELLRERSHALLKKVEQDRGVAGKRPRSIPVGPGFGGIDRRREREPGVQILAREKTDRRGPDRRVPAAPEAPPDQLPREGHLVQPLLPVAADTGGQDARFPGRSGGRPPRPRARGGAAPRIAGRWGPRRMDPPRGPARAPRACRAGPSWDPGMPRRRATGSCPADPRLRARAPRSAAPRATAPSPRPRLLPA